MAKDIIRLWDKEAPAGAGLQPVPCFAKAKTIYRQGTNCQEAITLRQICASKEMKPFIQQQL